SSSSPSSTPGWRRRRCTCTRSLVMKVVSFALLLLAALPHGKGKLKLDSQHLMAGQAVAVTGSEFAKSESFSILLVRAASRTTLAEIKSDAEGKLSLSLTLPAAAKAGNYRIVVEAADDDDEVASADAMLMEAGAPAALADHDEHQHEGMD